ncbi:hypothetical protein PR048_028365 [Dryococelus australis]|uniref:Uncharacterized protein n=1 Tax=Dryococelus australis TaxID=614101 RepID=A0ABQ9GJ05_9NEOP|nr:hypothetical protein PR048_028365 [Dryococelus australis]
MGKDDDIMATVRKHRVLSGFGLWAQFSRIDCDPELSNEEKFQYLLLSTVPKSRARAIIESFPPSRENYVKAICSLKETFGSKDLIVQFYMRDLLKLVTHQEVTMLFSCLPMEMLLHWERVKSDFNVPLKEQLSSLIVFVRREVQAEEHVVPANTSPNTPRVRHNERGSLFPSKKDHFVTTSDLASVNPAEQCLFVLDWIINDMLGPVGVLLGADVVGKIWSGHKVVLSTGVVADETLFRWTLMGAEKKPPVTCSTNLATTITMTTVTTGDVTNPWKLKAIGISDLTEENRYEDTFLIRTLQKNYETVGVLAVIENVILEIAVHPEDRDCLKFLWWTAADDEFRKLKHSRIVFGVTSSPFLLVAVLDYNLIRSMEECSPCYVERIEQLMSRFYVGNLVTSVDDIDEAQKVQTLATKIRGKGGEELTLILGLKWNRRSDTLRLNVDWWEKVFNGNTITKKNIISMMQRVFYPIDFVGPAMLSLKLMLKILWEKKLDCDYPLDGYYVEIFNAWLQQVPC